MKPEKRKKTVCDRRKKSKTKLAKWLWNRVFAKAEKRGRNVLSSYCGELKLSSQFALLSCKINERFIASQVHSRTKAAEKGWQKEGTRESFQFLSSKTERFQFSVHSNRACSDSCALIFFWLLGFNSWLVVFPRRFGFKRDWKFSNQGESPI